MSARSLRLIKVSSWPPVADGSFTPHCFQGCVIGLSWCALERTEIHCFLGFFLAYSSVSSCPRGQKWIMMSVERLYFLFVSSQLPVDGELAVPCEADAAWFIILVAHSIEIFIPLSPSSSLFFFFLHHEAKIFPSSLCVCLYTTKGHNSDQHLHSA